MAEPAPPLRIGVVYPELLGTYGDGGNGEVLAWRASRRGIPAELVAVAVDEPVPADLDAYVLGGSEDAAQATAARLLRSGAGDGLRAAVAEARPVLAVCGALQLLGRSYVDGSGRTVDGLGLLGLHTVAGRPRLVGEVVVRSGEGELLSGFENHGGRTWLEPGVEPLGTVVSGAGNNGEDATEGVRQGSVLGTYLHGPVLARNPFLADLVLTAALARLGVMAPPAPEGTPDPAVALHSARLREAARRPRR